jgi:multicomponent Na+:H+ antiporter subunit C
MMDTSTLYAGLGVLLSAMGLLGLVLGRHPIRKIIALNVIGAGIFLFLVAAAFRSHSGGPDPVLHAMVLTGIVVAVSATALGLTLAGQVQQSRSENEALANPKESKHEQR